MKKVSPNDNCSFTDMEGTYAEYEEWSDQGVSDTVSQKYKGALKQMEKSKPYEETLVLT